MIPPFNHDDEIETVQMTAKKICAQSFCKGVCNLLFDQKTQNILNLEKLVRDELLYIVVVK